MKSDKTMVASVKHRISILKGQLDGLQRMVDQDEYCIDLLNQSLAVQNSVKSLESIILERHLRRHVAAQFRSEKERAISELVKVFKRTQKTE